MDRVLELNEDLKKVQLKAKKRISIKSSACYLKRDANFSNILIKKYNILETYRIVLEDIALSLGKTPHGNAYNALRCRLKNGDWYTSNIDETYFYNCKSFSVNFTANFRNFASSKFIHSIIFQVLYIDGANRTKEADEKYKKTVEKYVNSKELVSLLLFYKDLQNTEREAFSFKNNFQNFFHNSMCYFNLTEINEKAYIIAIEQIILEVAQKALDLNVTL